MTDIFVSYAREDRDRVAKLVSALRTRGWSVWWDPTIAFGSDYAEAIEKALNESRCVLVAWSTASVGSHWVREEAAVGRSHGVLVPVLLDRVQPPIGFRHLQTADLSGWDGQPTASSVKLLNDVAELLDSLEDRSERLDDATIGQPEPDSLPPVPRGETSVRRRKLVAALAILLAIAALLAAVYLLKPSSSAEPLAPQTAVAVLPFENLTGNEQLGYVGHGLASGLIARLSASPGINVVGKSTAWAESESRASLAGLAESLGVSLLIDGEVRAEGDRLRVDVSAVDGPSSLVLRSESFQGELGNLYELQTQIIAAVTRLLSASLSMEEQRRIAAGGPPAQAFDFYLQGLERLDQPDNPRHARFAADLFRQAIRIDPDVASFHAALSDAIWTQYLQTLPGADLGEAEREARRALALDPDLPQAYLALARAMRGQGHYAESIALLRPVLAKHPKPDEAFRELGHGYERTGDTELAAECFENATTLGPDNWFNWNSRGVFEIRRWNLEAARESLTRASELAPESIKWPLLNLIGAKILLDEGAEAIAEWEALGVETSDPDLASNVATAYYFEGRLEEAVAMYRRAVELAPDDHINRRNLGDALAAEQMPEQAQEQYRAALGLVERRLAEAPESNDLSSARALYAAKMGECELALSQAEETRPLLGEEWQDHLHLAMAFALCERRDEALSELGVVVGMGFPGATLREQPELAGLVGDPAFEDLVGEG